MSFYFFELPLMLLVILAAAEIFTNALEHLGERLEISEGVTGSLFAAVGTALPETLVPLLAILGSVKGSAHVTDINQEIGVGAILGAPLMLATLTTFLMGLAALKTRGLRGRVSPEPTGFKRDLNFFLIAFGLAAVAMYIPHQIFFIRVLLSTALVALYVTYIVWTFRASKTLIESGHATEAPGKMLFCRLGLPANLLVIGIQLIAGLALLILGAEGFIEAVRAVSGKLGISALLLSMLIVPIATELPEKINSILWIRRGKDTLAFGNITGAMVFQGTLLPALGIVLTPWTPQHEVIISIFVTLLAALWMRFHARALGIALWVLLVNGALYLAYLAITLTQQ